MTTNNEWMLDVLDDLQAFCTKNGMDSAAVKIAETSNFLAEELNLKYEVSECQSEQKNHALM